MSEQTEQAFVMMLVEQIMDVLAGIESAQAQTALSLSVAAAIISTSKDAGERSQMFHAFMRQVEDFTRSEWVAFIKSVTTPVQLGAKRRQ